MERFTQDDGDSSEEESVIDSMSDDDHKIELNGNKRKVEENPNDSQKGSNKKKSKNELRKAPTAEELSRLQETENLFKSNLFRMQIDGMLAEIDVKEKYKRLFDEWFQNFTTFIEIFPEATIKLSELLNQKKKPTKKDRMFANISAKLTLKTDQDLIIKFQKPEQCDIFGLYKMHSSVGPSLYVDINVTMPKNCFLEKDFLNNRYLIKRECYLLYIYSLINESNLFSELTVKDTVLEIIPKASKKIKVCIHITPAENTFKLHRFEPVQNNIRDNLYDSFSDLDVVELRQFGTPYYNSVLLHSLTLYSNYKFAEDTLSQMKNIQDAIKLLLIWLKKRYLHGFTEILLVQTIVYLTLKRKINQHMSSYQVIRNFWVFMSTTDWHENPISVSEDIKLDKLKMFSEQFDVVFLDRSGSYNLAAFLCLDVYLKVKAESELGVKFLDDPQLDSFQALFMVEMHPELQYDALLSLSDAEGFKMVYDRIKPTMKYKYVGCYQSLIIKQIINKLKTGLNKRIHHIVPLTFPVNGDLRKLMFGITLNPSNAFSVIEKGPSANTSEAADFKKFWDELAECRRFADGSICEAVHFPIKTFQERRQIFKRIIDHVVKKKLKLQQYYITDNEFEQVLLLKEYVTPFPTGTCEEASLKVISIFDELSKCLKSFTLPLQINSVQGASEIFCYTCAFPPIPTNYRWGGKMTTSRENNIILKEGTKLGSVAKYVEAIECIIQLGMNSKWPKELDAFRQLKTGFYLELSKLLEGHEIISNVNRKCLDVFYKGLVFRFRLYHPKELSIIKQYKKSDGTITYKDTEESIQLDRNLNILPKIIGALNGLHSQHPSFGPSTTLIKRWIRSQLIDEYHIPDILISLINASLYINYAPFHIANLPQVAFLRFIRYIMNFDWNLHYIVVNFNNELTKEELDGSETNFQENRQNYPALYILTPFDGGKSVYSKKCSKQMLNRLSILAKISNELIHTTCLEEKIFASPQDLFNPNMEGYNVLIHIKPLMNPKRHQQLDCLKNVNSKIELEDYDSNKSTKMPVVQFNPVEIYLKELWACYGDFALFFHDPYGGNVIGVLWQPTVYDKTQFKVAHVEGKNIVDTNKLTLNIPAIIEEFAVLGAGLVRSVENMN